MFRLPLRAFAALVAAFAISPILQGACPDFAAAVPVTAGTTPSFAASGDFNGDGRRDLAVADPSGTLLWILLGDTIGTFEPGIAMGLAGTPSAIVAADLNGDGRADLAVGDTQGITILRDFGFGGFGDATFYPAPFARPVAAGDFDRNGMIDLAIANTNAATVSIYLNNGFGFNQVAVFSASTSPVAAVAGDFNRDGAIDLAVANSGADLVTLHDGNGNGTFAAARFLPIPSVAPGTNAEPSAIVAADFDEDGRLDLAVAATGLNRIFVYEGDGSGSFGSLMELVTKTRPLSLVSGDFDADGSTDLASADASSDSISIFSGNGAGGFAPAVAHPTGDEPTSLVAADFNRDAMIDLVSTDRTSGALSLLINNGACYANCGTFALPATFGVNSPGSAVATGDFDRDGAMDLVVTNQSTSNVSVVLGDGAGGFGSPNVFFTGSSPSALVVADVNQDGIADIAVANEASNNVAILLGDGSGSFNPAATFAVGFGAGPKGIAAGDFNRDGAVDFAVSCATSNTVVILRNNTTPGTGSPAFVDSTISSVGVGDGLRGIAAADVNEDGILDLLVANFSDGFFQPGSVRVLIGNFSGGFASPVIVTTDSGTEAVATGDFDGDGDLDLAATNQGSSNVTIAYGNGSGGFSSAHSIGVGSQPSAIVVTDVNLDGNLDLAIANRGASSITVLRGGGMGSFTASPQSPHSAGTSPAALAVADFNGDGKRDLAAAISSMPGNISVLLNDCPPPDLTIEKLNSGPFRQGGTGGYTIYVSNLASVPTSGAVRVVDLLPAGLTATGISGSGWDCTLSPLACTRSDSLGGSATWPPIGISVNIANNAPATVFNTVTVEGGADETPGNNTDVDEVLVTQHPDVTIAKSHSGDFAQGQDGATYTIVVTNLGGAPTSGSVSVTDSLPAGLTATALAGSGWNCTLGTLTCTRTDALAGGASYPAVTLTVSVSSTAATPRTNIASVTGGGELGSAGTNNSASDVTTIVAKPDLTIAKTHTGSFSQGQSGATYTIVVTNSGGAATSGAVTVSDTLPSGLTATALAGSGWSCTLASLSCTRADALAASASWPPVTLTVSVAANAASPLVNVASVSGGGEVRTTNNSASDPTVVQRAAQNCGRFAPATSIALPAGNPRGITIADLNGDGDADLASTDSYLNTLNIRLGNGDGTFAAPTTYATGAGASSPVAADFNHDDVLDLVVANVNSNFINSPGTISVFLGNGDGTFAPRVDYAAGHVPYSVTTGFFDGDAHLDLAVPVQQTHEVAVYLGNGDGTFDAAVRYPTALFPAAATVGDFNGDGKADLAVAASHGLSILLGAGDGTFGPKSDFMPATDPRGIVTADFNADAKLDVAIAYLYTQSVSVFIGNGDGTFAPRIDYPSGEGTFWVATADLDADGDHDLAAANNVGVAVLRGNGDGTFAAAVTLPGGTGALAVAIGDLNGDSRLDLATANEQSDDLSIILSGCTDLTVSKTHSGNFTQGQSGATYSIVVRNSDLIASSGTVTVTDTLPAGLVATGISGSGWTCTLATLSCTRSESLADASSFPPITVTVDVNSNAAATVTNVATVSGGGDDITSNNSASDPTTVATAPLIAPTRFSATAVSISQVDLTWDAVTNAVSYQIFRRSHGGAFAQITTTAATTFADTGRNPGVTYVYHVKAVSGAAATGPASGNDLATTSFVADDPLVPTIKAQHFTQLRIVIDQVRTAAGLGAATYTNAIVAGGIIRITDLTEMRTALNTARTALSVPPLNYTDPSVTTATRIKAAHIQELRNGTK